MYINTYNIHNMYVHVHVDTCTCTCTYMYVHVHTYIGKYYELDTNDDVHI